MTWNSLSLSFSLTDTEHARERKQRERRENLKPYPTPSTEPGLRVWFHKPETIAIQIHLVDWVIQAPLTWSSLKWLQISLQCLLRFCFYLRGNYSNYVARMYREVYKKNVYDLILLSKKEEPLWFHWTAWR